MENIIQPSTTGHPILPPGFRFHPTDEELVIHYLRKKASSCPLPVPIITDIDLYKFDPWELPAGKATFGEHEWYFFSPRDRKYPNGARPNRAAASGYWKATGTDKPITTSSSGQKVGVKKALVFYTGRPPKGVKTNWIMHEYRLTGDNTFVPKPTLTFTSRKSLRLDDWVLCRIYKKTPHYSPRPCGSKESEDSSCVEEVLASLPDVPDQKYSNLPKLGSFGVLTDADPFLESILTDPEAPIHVLSNHHVISNQQHHPQTDKSGSSINVNEKYVHPSSIRYSIPFPPGPTIKSEPMDNVGAKGSTQYTCTNDYLFGKSLFSLPNLTQKPHLHQHKLDLSGDDLERCYKWPLVARAN